jgi:hypothetical protein
MRPLAVVVALVAAVQLTTAQDSSSPDGMQLFAPVTWERLVNAADEPQN